jgi:hypothetical protein
MNRRKRDRDVLVWSRQIGKAESTREIINTISRMNPPVNCTHEAYIVSLSLASVDYARLLKKEESDEMEA